MSARSRWFSIAAMAGVLGVAMLAPLPAPADSVSLTAAHDNTIFEDKTSNSNGAGPVFFAGKNNSEKIRRAFIMFDVEASTIPAGSTIDSVTLDLQITNMPASPTATSIGLYRVSSAWGEGASSSSSGTGAPAQTGDVTWLVRSYPNSPWSVAGGDFDGTARGAGPVSTASGAYLVPSWPGMVEDVQYWLDHPTDANFGWMLRGDESAGAAATVRGFASREHATLYPVLRIVYTPFGAGVGPEGASALQMRVWPSPFRSEARLAFNLPRPGAVHLAIYDVRGREVALLEDGGMFSAGAHARSWDGRTSRGEPVAAGLYFARLTTSTDGSRTVRLLRLR